MGKFLFGVGILDSGHSLGTKFYLEESIYVSDPVVLGEGDLLNHLPGDGLEARQGQQDLPEPAAMESSIGLYFSLGI